MSEQNKKWDVVTHVPVRRVPKRNVILRSCVHEDNLGGRKYQIGMFGGGDICVEFASGPDEPAGELSADRFVVRIQDLMDAIGTVVAGGIAERAKPPERDVPFEGAYGTGKKG